ncbi:uncharacterized protein [Anabrus simplex]|uniref:uncharacterized protein n=1 Tax=Anabrus simplex TaxID=316456 RepID=UPI0035A32F70
MEEMHTIHERGQSHECDLEAEINQYNPVSQVWVKEELLVNQEANDSELEIKENLTSLLEEGHNSSDQYKEDEILEEHEPIPQVWVKQEIKEEPHDALHNIAEDVDEQKLQPQNMAENEMGKRKQWDKESMKMAINAVRDKKMGYKRASKAFKIPRATLKDYVKRAGGLPIEELVDTKIGRQPVLPKPLEDELVTYCMEMEKSFYGLSVEDLRRMAFQLAIRNNIRHPFSNDQKTAGRKWMHHFFGRHPQLSLRKPQPLSLARIQGFSRENVTKFYEILKPKLDKVNHNPRKIFNVNVTAISIVLNESQKIVALKGKREVHKLSSSERGLLLTVVMCMSAAGQYVPPMIIFPMKRMKPELMDGAPPGSLGAVNESGWITAELFEQWFHHFVRNVKPSKEDPVVLVLDGHYSHVRSINVIDSARDNGVSIVCLPPHSAAKMQPLDVAFMFPFMTFYAQAIENWLSSNPGRIVTNLQIARLFADGFVCTATMETAVNGFHKTGIFPYNPDIFSEEDYVACAQPEAQHEETEEGLILDSSVPSTSKQAFRFSLHQIRAMPVIHPSTSTRRRSALVVSGSPDKNRIQETSVNKNLVSITKNKRTHSLSRKSKKTNAIRRKPSNSSESDCSDDNKSADNEDSDEDDTACPSCGKLYSSDKYREKWIRCTKCLLWYHETCSSLTKTCRFICDTCLES